MLEEPAQLLQPLLPGLAYQAQTEGPCSTMSFNKLKPSL